MQWSRQRSISARWGGRRQADPFKGNKILVSGAGTVFSNKTSAINLFNCGCCFDNVLDVSGGARVEALDKFYVYGSGNAVRFADGAFPATPDCLSIVSGSSNVIEVANSTFPTTLTRLNVTSGFGHRISVTDGSRMFSSDSYGPFNGPVTGCVFEVTGGAVFARTNGNVSTYVANFAAARDNVIRVAGAGSKFLYDAFIYIGNDDSHETILVEQGGTLEYALRNSGGVYVANGLTPGNALIVRNAGSVAALNQTYIGANGASCCTVSVSDHAVLTNRSNLSFGYWKRDPAESQFSSAPGGTNTLVITSGAKCFATWLSASGVGNVIALTNGTLELTSSYQLVTGKWYALAIPDPIFETDAALAKLKTIPRDMKIMIGGTNSVIRGQNMRFAKGTQFSFAVPAAGYVQAPLQSSNIIELIDCGKASFDTDAFRAAHPKESVVLMETASRIDIDETSLAAFNEAAGECYKVSVVGGKKLVLKPHLGWMMIFK